MVKINFFCWLSEQENGSRIQHQSENSTKMFLSVFLRTVGNLIFKALIHPKWQMHILNVF